MSTLIVTHATDFKKTAAPPRELAAVEQIRVSSGQSFEVDYAYRVSNHCLVKLKHALEPIGKVGYFDCSHVDVPLEEIRAVWLTNVDSQVLHSADAIADGLQRLKAIGFNTLYPVVWSRGFTLYPSPVAAAFVGEAVMPRSPFQNRDMLSELIQTARSLKFRIIPWFEYGLMTLPNSAIEKRHPHVMSLDCHGNMIRIRSTDGKPDTHSWMNPCHPEVQAFVIDLITEVISTYDVDGIQLDDHFCFPVELGYEDVTQALYRAEHPSKSAPANHHHPAWRTWASQKMTALMTQLVTAVKTQNRDCLISLSPNPLGFTQANLLVDWQAWIQQGLIDELVLQVYRDRLSAFNQELDKPEVRQARNRIPVIIGILTGLRTRSIATSTIAEQIQTTRRKHFAGISCFFYETVFNQALGPEAIARTPSELQTFFT